MSRLIFQFLILSFLSVSCADFNVGRSYLSEMDHDDSTYFKPREDFNVVAGDTGRDWMTDRERRNRTPGSEFDREEDLKLRSLKKELRDLEGVQTEQNLAFYEKYKELNKKHNDRRKKNVTSTV